LLYAWFPRPEVARTDESQVYEGQLWKDELENVLMPMLEKWEVALVDDPDGLIHW
jgi:PhnB protein